MRHPAGWLAEPSGTGVHIAADSGDWEFLSYPDLAAGARRTATRLIGLGVRREDVVCLVLPSDRELITAIYGVWAAGATICPVTPPLFDAADAYVEHIAGIFGQAAPRVVVTIAPHEPLVTAALSEAGVSATVSVADDTSGEDPAEIAEPASIALLQFTSGSTGTPRGVRVSFDNLIANFGAFDYFARGDHGDGFASWLPIHHDMGLIGGLMFPVANQMNLWIMRPDQFIRDPARWLECFAPGRARHTACPPFGLAYAARKVKPARLAALDLRGLRSIVTGAESVDPAVLTSFTEFAARAGFPTPHCCRPTDWPRTPWPSHSPAAATESGWCAWIDRRYVSAPRHLCWIPPISVRSRRLRATAGWSVTACRHPRSASQWRSPTNRGGNFRRDMSVRSS